MADQPRSKKTKQNPELDELGLPPESPYGVRAMERAEMFVDHLLAGKYPGLFDPKKHPRIAGLQKKTD